MNLHLHILVRRPASLAAFAFASKGLPNSRRLRDRFHPVYVSALTIVLTPRRPGFGFVKCLLCQSQFTAGGRGSHRVAPHSGATIPLFTRKQRTASSAGHIVAVCRASSSYIAHMTTCSRLQFSNVMLLDDPVQANKKKDEDEELGNLGDRFA